MPYDLLSILCFLAGAGACFRALTLMPRLGREKKGDPLSRKRFWMAWMPGEFTPEGRRLRSDINWWLLLGWMALVAGLFLRMAAT